MSNPTGGRRDAPRRGSPQRKEPVPAPSVAAAPPLDDHWHRVGYPITYVLGLIGLLCLSYLLFQGASEYTIILPMEFDTTYHAIRSIISIGFLAFVVVLMVRHCALVLVSTGDQIDRYLADRRPNAFATMPAPFVSIIVPAFNEGKVIQASIRSLLAMNYPRFEVIVVDDGSTDDTLERARELEGQHGAARVLVFWKPNGGKARALNFGIERAAGDYVTTMDGDSHLTPDTLMEAMPYFSDPDVGAVAGNVRVGNVRNLWTRLQSLEYVRGLNLVRRAQSFIRASIVVPGPIGVFRKVALQEVGLYDADTFAEDCDLTLKLMLAGWKICYEPRAIAITEAPEDLVSLVRQRYRWTRGMLQSLLKHKRRLVRPKGAFVGSLMLWYLLFEVLIWPLMSGVSLVFLGFAAADASLHPAAAYYWFQILLLEVVSAWYCIGIEETDLRTVLFAPIERLMFHTLMDVCRLFSCIEEFLGNRMSWGKLERKGRL
jgi:poly-beta-1,6-N-acetyl-D-glucosamine synthase